MADEADGGGALHVGLCHQVVGLNNVEIGENPPSHLAGLCGRRQRLRVLARVVVDPLGDQFEKTDKVPIVHVLAKDEQQIGQLGDYLKAGGGEGERQESAWTEDAVNSARDCTESEKSSSADFPSHQANLVVIS